MAQSTTHSRIERLRNAIQRTGLVVDPSQHGGENQSLVVSNRLAQTSLRYLRDVVDPTVAASLREDLRTLGGEQELTILTEETGFTFYHVVQYIYEFAKQSGRMPEGRDFCEEMGYGGGGIEVAPHLEVVSLVTLLISALPPHNDSESVGILIRDLFPQILGRIFPSDLLQINVDPGIGAG